MAQEEKRDTTILGDINPTPSTIDRQRGRVDRDDPDASPSTSDESTDTPAPEHAGTRDVGPIGGTGTEVGGTRNYRTGSGATGGDIGNRPE
jgi:hypothetical protein